MFDGENIFIIGDEIYKIYALLENMADFGQKRNT